MGEKKRETIDQLKERYQQLNEKKITAAADLKNAKKQLAELKKSAKEQYGTDDLDELRKRLAEMKDANERKRSEYQTHLEKIEVDLQAVDLKFAEASAQSPAEEKG